MADDLSKNLTLLTALLSQPNAEVLRQVDLDNMGLGEFVKTYASTPAVVDVSVRSSLREDSVIAELSRLLLDSGEEAINLLDACCGVGTLAKRIVQSMGDEISRISYIAIDEHPASIRSIRVQEREFSGFRSFKFIQRQISDLDDLAGNSVDLIVLNNALHEIPPRLFPKMFTCFNGLLNTERGLLCVVDMESLPEDQPESLAIPWNADEVAQFLKAGGLSAVVTRHPKLTMVYHAQVKHSLSGVDESKMLERIQSLLQSKLSDSVIERQRLEATLLSNPSKLREWVVLTGTIARYAEELQALASA